jgi:hypothetical protein
MQDAAQPPGAQLAAAAAATKELPEEVRVGGTPAGRAVNAALLALSRTARSFTLYDARNQAVREFLRDLKAKLGQALEVLGKPLELEVRSFELVLAGEVVYLERDRERSLAFRLFRDGVRRLTLRPGLSWDEVLGLVEILSVRYSGVRQAEDDLVTLLSKAGFTHIDFVAIEGFVPEEEVEEQGAAIAQATHIAPPPDWDLPPPRLEEPLELELSFRPLSAATLAKLRGEHDEESTPRECVNLVRELLQPDVDVFPANDVALETFLFEIRDFLLSEGRFVELLQVVEALEAGPRAVLLQRFGGPATLKRLVQGEALPENWPGPEVLQYLRRIPGEHLAQLIELLAAERDLGPRVALQALITGLAADDPNLVLERIAHVDNLTACDLLQAIATAAPEQAPAAALKLLARGDAGLQSMAVAKLAQMPYSSPIGRAVVHLLATPDADVRDAAVRYLGDHPDPRAHEALVRHIQERAGGALTDAEADTLGETLARQDAGASLDLFATWLQPRGLLQRVVESSTQRHLHRAAIAGLAGLPGEEPETLLRSFLGQSSGDMHQVCLAALVQRRRRQRERAGVPDVG